MSTLVAATLIAFTAGLVIGLGLAAIWRLIRDGQSTKDDRLSVKGRGW